jgi:hypothetical protein
LPQCQKGCCVLGNNAAYSTSNECAQLAASVGLQKDFRPEIQSEIACLALAGSSDQGACVFAQADENSCKFTTRPACTTLGGSFYNNYLCSNPLLGTNCRPQAKAECIRGKDQIYWFDSCGNQENIYSADKVQSYNNGMIQPLNETCALGTAGNPLANQNICGNCNYLLGSTCGASTATEKLADNTISFVCKSLSCTDSAGVAHKNGESWCSYEGSIGVDNTNNRATDTVGSRQFRRTCLNGVISTELCGDYRTGICVQSLSGSGTSSFTSAACRANSAMECLNYNVENETDQCTQNSDCFIKHVQVGDTYKFDFCASKYPIGFDLSNNAESGQAVCGMASQTCTAVYVKTLFHGWQCKQNCDCEKPVFAQQMNNLCTSIGDCGAKVNYVGSLSQSYKISNSPRLDSNYLAGLSVYKNSVSGQYAESGDSALFSGALGIPSGLGSAGQQNGSNAAATAGKIGGMIGVTLGAMAYAAPTLFGVGGTTAFFAGAGHVLGIGTTSIAAGSSFVAPAGGAVVYGSSGTSIVAAGQGGIAGSGGATAMTGNSGAAAAGNPGMAAAGGALMGAAIGFAVTGMLIKMLGIGPGLPSGLVTGMLAAGAIAGAIAGYSIAGGTFSASFSLIPVIGWILAIIVIVIMIISKILGVGKSKKVEVNFQCQPWQAPTGGTDCAKCGQDGLPCTRYGCESLGQTCELINEGTGFPECISNSINDVTPPVIDPLDGALPGGYSYTNVTDGGYSITGPDGCFKEYTPVTFGISTAEPSQCAYDTVHTNSFSDMEFDFGGNNLFLRNHTTMINIPSLESLGLPGYDPNAQANYSLYVRCQDKNGNQNLREYAISFCVKPGDDVTPPLISRGSPVFDFLPYSATQQDASVYTNEPADCKWDVQNIDYYNMTNQFGCANDLEDQQPLGWLCNTTFPITSINNSFYVRCLDQPWVNMSDPNNTKTRNVNTNSFVFSLQKTSTPLTITSASPNATTLRFSVSPATVTLNVQTSGGVDGTAICSADFGGGHYVTFLNTGGRVHSWELNQFTEGDKQVNIQCKDIAGNIAQTTLSFDIIIDTNSPQITRVYESGGALNIITNENSTCYYNKQSCIYDLDNATEMSGAGLVHTTSFDSSLDYYLKCKDSLGNVPGACSVVVRQGVIS